MTVQERLKTYIKYKRMSVRSFEIKCGLSTSYISNIRISIQPDKVNSISKHFSDLNTGWLLTGEGEMLKERFPKNVVKEDSAEHGSKEALLATIQNLSEALNRISKENQELKKLLDQNKKTSNVPMEDAGCADVG